MAEGSNVMAKSEAARQVKLGFWVAAGFWTFGIVAIIIMILIVRAMGSTQ